MDAKNGNNGWLQKILERIEDHILEQRRINDRSERRWEEGQRRWEQSQRRWEEGQRRWERNDQRWQANHKIVVHMLEEIRRLKQR